ncbi:uncharacterized protein [Euphorbia lathyris]|uniref:uncharacterized protein n=1 Tax=Euphorbia lathyris TaxID=212925 RepID=UPI003313A99D
MDEVFGREGSKYRISLADSTMMLILNRAMDKAHDRAQRREGPIECLTAISMFYELAVMQLEGCLKFLQEESDSSFESSDEEVLRDLAEIRDRLLRRLKDAEFAISEKDKELTRTLENELKLKKVLEIKEKELDFLRAGAGDDEELSHGNQVGVVEERDEDFSGLKHSVEQQVWSIKQKLEPESKSLDRRRNRSCDSFDIELMGIDIDILKETMDIAFGKMQSAIFSSEMEPVEHQWMWTVEKDALSILIKGFMRDFQSEIHQISEHWSDSMREIRFLHDELLNLCLSESNHEGKIISSKAIGKSSSDENNEQNQSDDETEEDDGGNLVAKMIKNHESIIKKKSKEVNWEKREIMGEKRCSYPWGEEDAASAKKRMQDVITRMGRLIDQNENFDKTFNHHIKVDGKEEGSLSRTLYKFHKKQDKQCQIGKLKYSQERMNKTSISEKVYEAFQGEMKILKEEEEASLQTLIMKKTCATLLKGLVSDSSNKEKVKMVNKWNDQMESDKLDIQIREEIQYMVFKQVVKDFCAQIYSLEDKNLAGELREEISKVYFAEICKEWNEIVGRYDTEYLVREEIHQIASRGCLRDITETTDHIITKLKELILETKLREEVYTSLFGELHKEWKEVIETPDTERLIGEKIYQIALEESLKDMINSSNRLLGKPDEAKNSTNCIYSFGFQCLEHSIEEDICKVLFRETYRGWKKEIDNHNFESLIKEEVFLLVVSESVKEASFGCREAAAQNHFELLEESTSFNNSDRSPEVWEDDLLTQKHDPELNCIEVEKGLIQTESSEFKEDGLNHLKQENLNKIKISGELLSEMRSTCTSMSSKVKNALDHLAMSKALVNELRSCLLVAVEGVESFDEKVYPSSSESEMESSWFQKKAIRGVKVQAPSYSSFMPIMEFLQVFIEFKCRVEKSLELNIMKLEGAIRDLNPLAQVVARQRRKIRLYQKGFLNRCENLRKAEAEVDLLGNQVEVLLVLLQKIYNILHQYSPALQQYFEVSEILKLIRKELIGEVNDM